ncbi:Bidirectional sugar transporter SWEET1 [Linum perenne]
MTDIPHFIFGILGNAFAAFLFLAPTITFRRIIKNKSTEEFSGVPYPMTLLNCLLSAWYGLPFVSKDNLLVTTINGTGAAIEIIYVIIFLVFAPKKQKIIYVIIFLVFAPKKQKAKIGGIFAAVLSVFAAVSLISYFALHGNTRKLFCGTAETVFSIIMYASPLSIMRLVIKTKSVEFMPFFTLRLPMRHFLVHLWPTRSRPFHS